MTRLNETDGSDSKPKSVPPGRWDALAAVGLQVESVWDLLATSGPYAVALPVLEAHLERSGYP